MKRILAGSVFFALTFFLVHAQDDAPPPPPSDQMAPADDLSQGPDQAPPPGQDQAAPGADDQGASFQTFYDNLSSQGTWVQTDNYGYAFQPNVSDPNWSPYSNGSWVYTEDGWTWVSDEPWGWATYHYGRWVNIDGMGWVWIPGYRWAPAWVSWRFGGGYCGWAPLPPETFIGVEFGGGGWRGYHFGGDVDTAYHIGPGYYNFVPVGRMGDPNLRGAIVNRNHNFSIINRTTNITNLNFGGNGGGGRFAGVTANGPSLAAVNAQSSRPVRTMRLASASGPGRASIQGNSLAVFAPNVNAATARSAHPTSVSRNIGQASFNRGDSITRPLVVTPSVRPPAPTQAEIQQAHLAQAHIPASAGVATTHTPVRSVNLTTQAPVTENRTVGAANHTFHPQSQNTGQVVRPENSNVPPPEKNFSGLNRTETQPHAAEVHHTETQTFQPQVQHTSNAPAPSFHEERHETSHPAEVQHAVSAPHTETHAAPPHTEAAHESASHPSSGGGKPKPKPAGKPAPADGKADDKKPNG